MLGPNVFRADRLAHRQISRGTMDEVPIQFREVLSVVGCTIVQCIEDYDVLSLGIAARRLHVAIAIKRNNEMQAKYNRIVDYHQHGRFAWRFKWLARVAYLQEKWLWDVDPAYADQECAKLWESQLVEARRRKRYLIELQAGMDVVPTIFWRSWG